MARPCFLVIDREFPGSISTRKLVIETAKMNVLTAYSGQEALEMLARFPAVDGAVVDAGLEDVHCSDLIRSLKKLQPHLPVIGIHTPGRTWCEGADHQLEHFDPAALLELLQAMTPEQTAETRARDHELRKHPSS